MMKSTKTTTKTNHYFRMLTMLAVLATVAAMLLSESKPSYAASNHFTVTRIDDRADVNPGDGICSISTSGTFCTLRAAIQEANATPDADTITFNINAAGGVATITPNSDLPRIKRPVTIDGYTQPGAQKNTLSQGTNAQIKVELSGANAGANAEGLYFDSSFGDPSGSVVRGLAINRFSGVGIDMELNANSFPNIVGNHGFSILGNFIGTDPSGTLDRGNGLGVFIGNKDFVSHLGHNFIGDGSLGGRNLISGNDQDGVRISPPFGGDAGTGQYQVLSNLIGTNRDGTGALGNSGSGVVIHGTSGNFVQSNTVAFNGLRGVSVEAASSTDDANDNAVFRNSIFSNGALGIDLNTLGPLGPTPNDLGDPDHGANGLQNFPVITSARNGGGKTAVKGTLNSLPNTHYLLQFFSNPSGGDEGKVFVGEKTVFTDGSGNVFFGFQPTSKVARGRTITATATLFESSSHLNTSEFSAPRTVK